MKKGTINTIADYLYKRPGSRFSFVFAFFLLEERTGKRSDTIEVLYFPNICFAFKNKMHVGYKPLVLWSVIGFCKSGMKERLFGVNTITLVDRRWA